MKPGYTYHLYNHGNAFDDIFRHDKNYLYFLERYSLYVQPIANTYAYCLLPNHFHFLLGIKTKAELDQLRDMPHLHTPQLLNFLKPTSRKIDDRVTQQFSNCFNAYARSYNNTYDRKGKLFLLPFQKKRIINEKQFLNTWKYIHFNPVHHGFCQDPSDWPFSSVHDYTLKSDGWVATTEARNISASDMSFKGVGEFRPEWKEFINLGY